MTITVTFKAIYGYFCWLFAMAMKQERLFKAFNIDKKLKN